jgi:hypothetical protein
MLLMVSCGPISRGILRHGETDETERGHLPRGQFWREGKELAMLRVLTFCVFCLVVCAIGFSLWLGTVAVILWPTARRRVQTGAAASPALSRW